MDDTQDETARLLCTESLSDDERHERRQLHSDSSSSDSEIFKSIMWKELSIPKPSDVVKLPDATGEDTIGKEPGEIVEDVSEKAPAKIVEENVFEKALAAANADASRKALEAVNADASGEVPGKIREVPGEVGDDDVFEGASDATGADARVKELDEIGDDNPFKHISPMMRHMFGQVRRTLTKGEMEKKAILKRTKEEIFLSYQLEREGFVPYTTARGGIFIKDPPHMLVKGGLLIKNPAFDPEATLPVLGTSPTEVLPDNASLDENNNALSDEVLTSVETADQIEAENPSEMPVALPSVGTSPTETPGDISTIIESVCKVGDDVLPAPRPYIAEGQPEDESDDEERMLNTDVSYISDEGHIRQVILSLASLESVQGLVIGEKINKIPRYELLMCEDYFKEHGKFLREEHLNKALIMVIMERSPGKPFECDWKCVGMDMRTPEFDSGKNIELVTAAYYHPREKVLKFYRDSYGTEFRAVIGLNYWQDGFRKIDPEKMVESTDSLMKAYFTVRDALFEHYEYLTAIPEGCTTHF